MGAAKHGGPRPHMMGAQNMDTHTKLITEVIARLDVVMEDLPGLGPRDLRMMRVAELKAIRDMLRGLISMPDETWGG